MPAKKKSEGGAKSGAAKKAAKKATTKATKAAEKKPAAKKAVKKAAKTTEKKSATTSTKSGSSKSGSSKSASAKSGSAKGGSTKKSGKATETKASAGRNGSTPPRPPALGARRLGIHLAPGVMIRTRSGSAPSCGHDDEDKKPRKLTKKDLRTIEDRLKVKREELIHGMRKELEDSRLRSEGGSADPVDQAADSCDDDVAFEIASNSNMELEAINQALARLREGSYGMCESCETPLSPSRLKLVPWATECVACQKQKEATARRSDSTWAFVADTGEEDEES